MKSDRLRSFLLKQHGELKEGLWTGNIGPGFCNIFYKTWRVIQVSYPHNPMKRHIFFSVPFEVKRAERAIVAVYTEVKEVLALATGNACIKCGRPVAYPKGTCDECFEKIMAEARKKGQEADKFEESLRMLGKPMNVLDHSKSRRR